jgi:hypothetical protein
MQRIHNDDRPRPNTKARAFGMLPKDTASGLAVLLAHCAVDMSKAIIFINIAPDTVPTGPAFFHSMICLERMRDAFTHRRAFLSDSCSTVKTGNPHLSRSDVFAVWNISCNRLRRNSTFPHQGGT